ncbi:MAG: hypothetical protein ABI534_02825 [Chloroflexota bacterium]
MSGPAAIARIPLARSLPRLLALPLVAIAAGGLSIAAGLILLHGSGGLVLAIFGGVAVALGLALGLALLSIRLEVTEDGLRVGSILGSRRHVLATGPVTRLAIAGADAVPIHSAFGARAWAYGRARLRDREPIWVVRLAPVDALVVIPTDRGRLAVAPRSERVLLESLAQIGLLQEESARPPDGVVDAEQASVPFPAPAVSDPVPRLLTGIERSIVWDLLEAARIDEEAAAERAAADAEAGGATDAVSPGLAVGAGNEGQAVERAERRRWTLPRRRAPQQPKPETAVDLVAAVPPGEIELHAPTPEPAPMLAPAVAERAIVATAAPARRRRRSRLRRRIDRLLSLPPAGRLRGIGLIALPLALVVIGWFSADRIGTLPDNLVGLRSVALTVLLAGPITALGAIIARAAAPRLVGLVVMSAMVAIVITARALMP